MTQGDLDDVIGAFAEAAAAAERIGFDGVELHGAHGYLLDQFLWAGTNRRTDAYGGDPVARTKFAAEIVAAVRETVSADFPVIFRYSQWKPEAYDARLAADPGGAGGRPRPARRRRRRRFPRLHPPLLAPGVRRLRPQPRGLDEEAHRQAHHHRRLGRPRRRLHPRASRARAPRSRASTTFLTGMERDEFDMVAVGRALLQDPEWAAKVLGGRLDELKPYDAAALKTLS